MNVDGCIAQAQLTIISRQVQVFLACTGTTTSTTFHFQPVEKIPEMASQRHIDVSPESALTNFDRMMNSCQHQPRVVWRSRLHITISAIAAGTTRGITVPADDARCIVCARAQQTHPMHVCEQRILARAFDTSNALGSFGPTASITEYPTHYDTCRTLYTRLTL